MGYRSRDELLSHTLSPEEVKELIHLHKKGRTHKQLAEKFKIHRNTVGNILDRAKKAGVY